MKVFGCSDSMQLRGSCDAGPRMVRRRFLEVQILEMERLSRKVGGEMNVIG